MPCTISSGRLIDCKDVAGGIKALYFGDFIDSYYANMVFTAGVLDGVNLASTVYKYEVRPSTAGLTTTVSNEPTGSAAYNTAIEATFHKLTQVDNEKLQALIAARFFCYVLDANDQLWCVGAINGATVTGGTFVTGVGRSDLAGYTITITADENAYPIECAPSVSAASTDWPFDGIDGGTAVITVG